MKLDIYVINLNKRQDRMEKIYNRFQSHFNIIRVEAIENENGALGCFLSHQKCIRIAKELGLSNILVLEDDCEPLISIDLFEKQLVQIKNYLDSKDDWNIFLGCANKIRYSNILSKIPDSKLDGFNLYIVNFGKTAHLIWYNNKTYDYYLGLTYSENLPIDRVWHGVFNAIVIIPFITTQSDDYSDIENKSCSYTQSIKRYERKLLNELKLNNTK